MLSVDKLVSWRFTYKVARKACAMAKLGVEFYGAPEEGNSCTIASLSPRDICRGIGLQGLQRRRRNLVKGNVESPDRIQRLTQRSPHFGSFLAQHLQYFFLGCSLACSCASTSPELQFTAFNPITY